MENEDYLKVMALVIVLLLILDVMAILNLNGFRPTITTKNMKSEEKEVQLEGVGGVEETRFGGDVEIEKTKNRKFL